MKNYHEIKCCKLYGYLALIVLLLVSNLSIGQSTGLQLGNMSYGRVSTPHLVRTVSRSASFFRGVGGVAFEAVAIGKDGLVVTNLIYNANMSDGKRLEIHLHNSQNKLFKINADIYDWQFIPIAKFSDSKYGSAMTLFGEAADAHKEVADEIRGAGGRIINYHASFENTLVGLRLFQADVLIFQSNAADLFKNSSGNYILGAGEKGHELEANNKRFKEMKTLLEMERKKGNTEGRSTFWQNVAGNHTDNMYVHRGHVVNGKFDLAGPNN